MQQDSKPEDRAWTTAEAAFIVGERLEAFKKVVERSPVKPVVKRRGRSNIRVYAFRDLVFLYAYRDLQKDFTNDGRTRIYQELLRLPSNPPSKVEAGDFVFNFGRHLAAIKAKTKALDQYASQVDTSGGEPLIKGTSIEVYRIAALLEGGMSVKAVLKDYPSLKDSQVFAAQAWAVSHPKLGRPFPKHTAKAAMRDADLGALDELLGARE